MSVKTLLTHFCGYYFIAVEPFPRMHVFKLDRYINNDYMYFVMAIEISALAFVIFYTVKEVKKIKEQGKKYFKVLIYLFLIVLIIITIQLKKAGCICT